jgi:hypothetical protein
VTLVWVAQVVRACCEAGGQLACRHGMVLGGARMYECDAICCDLRLLCCAVPCPKCRPYLYTSYVCGCGGLLYVTPKACLYSYPVAWLPPAAIMVTFATFSWCHILAARWVTATAQHTGAPSRAHTPAEVAASCCARTLPVPVQARVAKHINLLESWITDSNGYALGSASLCFEALTWAHTYCSSSLLSPPACQQLVSNALQLAQLECVSRVVQPGHNPVQSWHDTR